MVPVNWTRRALDELDAIAAYISLDSPAIADAFARKLVEATRHLSEFPRSGRLVPELGHEDIREVLVQRYRIIYRVRADRVTILTIQHGARRLESGEAGAGAREEE